MRTIVLSKMLCQDIYGTVQHFIENQDRTLPQDYEELRDMIDTDINRFKISVTISERIPHCHDVCVNILVKHIMEVIDCNEDDTEEMNAFYHYCELEFDFDGEDHAYLLKATSIEALEYMLQWINDGAHKPIDSGILTSADAPR